MAKLNLTKLIAQKNALEKQIAEAQRAHRGDAIAKVRAMMAEFGVTAADLGGQSGQGGSGGSSQHSGAESGNGAAKTAPRKAAKRAGPAAGKKVPAKYRNPATGDSWSGRGLKPKWLTAALASGREITEFAV